jgi:hypothetical protein
MRKFQRILTLCLWMLVVSTGMAQAVILLPTVDGTLFDFGDDGTVNFINSYESVQALNMIGFDSRGIMEFDLDGVSGPVTNAFLRLYKIEALGPFPMSIDVYGYEGDGMLSSADYSDGFLMSSFSYNNENTFDLDLTEHVEDVINNAYSFLGINLRIHDEFTKRGAPPYTSFGSLEYPPANELHIERTAHPVPEPGSFLLMGCGLLGVFARSRQNKQACF